MSIVTQLQSHLNVLAGPGVDPGVREVATVAQLMVETAAGNRTICRPIGDLDMVGAELLRRAGPGLLTTGGPVVIDLSGVTFIDSAGVCALVGLARRSSECGGRICFVGARRSVSRVLSMTRVDQLLTVPPKAPNDTAGGPATRQDVPPVGVERSRERSPSQP